MAQSLPGSPRESLGGARSSDAGDEKLAQELLEIIQSNVLEAATGLRTDSNLFEAGLDSMAIMQLLLLIEERYGLMLSASEVTRDNFATAQVLATLVRQRLETKDAAGNA